MLIRDAEVSGQRLSVRMADGLVVAMGPTLPAVYDEQVIEAHGGLLLPGLHDHHIHVRALAAAMASLNCGPEFIADRASLARALAAVPGTGWIRGVGYDDTHPGTLNKDTLNRHTLDELCPQRPVRLQHRTGKMWVLNSAALKLLDLCKGAALPEGVECDTQGVPTGRLFRLDAWLHQALDRADAQPDLSGVSAALTDCGITAITDTSYTNKQADVDKLQNATEFLPRVSCMGDASLAQGHLKIMLDEDQPPDLDALLLQIRTAHERDRGVAFHAVTRIELLLALGALEASGPHPADRIEHAAVVDDDCLDPLARSGVTVVSQPGFIAQRGDMYRRQFGAHSATLYRYASLLAHGIPVAASSDAPYGPVSPWVVIQAAMDRKTPAGEVMGADECVSAAEGLRGYLAPKEKPGAPARRIEVGMVADLCLLTAPWTELGLQPGQAQVAGTWIGGQSTGDFQSGGAPS